MPEFTFILSPPVKTCRTGIYFLFTHAYKLLTWLVQSMYTTHRGNVRKGLERRVKALPVRQCTGIATCPA